MTVVVATPAFDRLISRRFALRFLKAVSSRGKVMQKMKADSLAELVKMAARIRLRGLPKA